MIKRLELKNFTIFNDLQIDFSPGINVIIGENATGKTLALKAAYGLCVGAPRFDDKPDVEPEELEAALTDKFIKLFLPLDDKLGKLHRQGANEKARLQAHFDREQTIAATFFNNSKTLAIKDIRVDGPSSAAAAVFIPTKEVIAFMKGFISLYEKFRLSFDQTYQDVCLLLDLPNMRPENLHEKSKWAIDEIRNVCGGRFVFHGGGRVTFQTKKAEYSANAIAEGFRKLGVLCRLLETGAVDPGVGGPLFWDEPEANLNPKLMNLLVEILLELSRNGQQIILATHDYVLLKWLDLLMDDGKGDRVRFHALQKCEESNRIEAESADDYNLISKSSISDAFAELYDEDVKRALGQQ